MLREVDELKIIIALVGSIISFNFLTRNTKNLDEKEKEKFYLICLIRVIIVLFSIKDNWPIERCMTINLIITILTISATNAVSISKIKSEKTG